MPKTKGWFGDRAVMETDDTYDYSKHMKSINRTAEEHGSLYYKPGTSGHEDPNSIRNAAPAEIASSNTAAAAETGEASGFTGGNFNGCVIVVSLFFSSLFALN